MTDRVKVPRFILAQEAFHIACGTAMAFRRDSCGESYEGSLADHFAGDLSQGSGSGCSLASQSARRLTAVGSAWRLRAPPSIVSGLLPPYHRFPVRKRRLVLQKGGDL
jgi:hypothetical protein